MAIGVSLRTLDAVGIIASVGDKHKEKWLHRCMGFEPAMLNEEAYWENYNHWATGN